MTPGKFAFEDVVIEGPTPDARPFFSARRITVEVPWWTLFRGDLYIDVRLSDWRMVVEKWPDGQAHLPKLTGKPARWQVPVQHPRASSVYCSDGEFIYDDHVTPWRVTGPNLKFDLVRASNLNTYVGLAQFSKGTVQIQNFEPMSADFRTWFQVDGGIVRLKHIDLLTDGAESHINGYVNFGNWPEQEYRIQSTVDFNRMRELFFAKATWRLSGDGRFNGVFKIFKKGGFDLSGLFQSDEAGLGIGNSEWRFRTSTARCSGRRISFIVQPRGFGFSRRPHAHDVRASARRARRRDRDADRRLQRRRSVPVHAAVRLDRARAAGSMRGQVSMAWHNGQFTETLQGRGTTVVTPPGGQSLAAAVLPAGADPVPAERPFQKYRPFGEFPIGADTTYRFTGSTLDFDPGWVATPTTYVRFERARTRRRRQRALSRDEPRLAERRPVVYRHHVELRPSDRRHRRRRPRHVRRRADEGLQRAAHRGAIRRRPHARVGCPVGPGGRPDRHRERVPRPDRRPHSVSGRRPRPDVGPVSHWAIRARIRARKSTRRFMRSSMPMQPLRTAFGLDEWPVDGTLAAADLELTGAYEKPGGHGTMRHRERHGLEGAVRFRGWHSRLPR